MSALFAAQGMHVASASILSWVVQAVVFGSVLAVMTWLIVRIPARRAQPALHGALWFVVLLKFVVPVGPPASFSLASAGEVLKSRWSAQLVPSTGAHDGRDLLDALLLGSGGSETHTESPSPPPARIHAVSVVATLYVLGVLIVAVVRLNGYRRLVKACRGWPLAPEVAYAVVRRTCKRLGYRRSLTVRMSNEAPAPFVLGVLHPTLVLSRGQLTDERELEAVVLHEMAHLRRGDLLVRYVQWFTGTLLFFWPVVAWVNRRIDLARERTCDEWALRHGRLSAAEYARCLLRAVSSERPYAGAYHPAAMASNLFSIERRIEMILNRTPSRTRRLRLGLPAGLLLLAWTGFVLAGASVGDEPRTEESHGKLIHIQRHHEHDLQHVQEMETDVDTDVHVNVMFGAHEDHASSDHAEGDVHRSHHLAHVVARGMLDPYAVLKQFPDADEDEDGELDEWEMATLIGAGRSSNVFHEVLLPTVKKQVIVSEDGSSIVLIDEPAVELLDSSDESHVDLAIGRGEDTFRMTADRIVFQLGPAEAAGRWISENIAGEPVEEDVAYYVEVVEEVRNEAILERHPEADADGDGVLSSEEREFLHKGILTRINQSVLTRIHEQTGFLQRTLQPIHEHLDEVGEHLNQWQYNFQFQHQGGNEVLHEVHEEDEGQ